MRIETLLKRVNAAADKAEKRGENRRVAAAWAVARSGVKRWEGLSTYVAELDNRIIAAADCGVGWALIKESAKDQIWFVWAMGQMRRAATIAHGPPNVTVAYPSHKQVWGGAREIMGLRLSTGLSRRTWGEKLGASIRTVQGWERGRQPTLMALQSARRFTGIGDDQ